MNFALKDPLVVDDILREAEDLGLASPGAPPSPAQRIRADMRSLVHTLRHLHHHSLTPI